ncbi:recombinase family protein [Paraburkholderia bryophila]|uniref:DNA invertase Pin-like site-specific DNA recombinase n=1 Tax=Paraburkholderia bryophila TaxID=420952 RepID=A0A7Y9W3H1_9BURK|nr:recombinase family protein [Paraburkholderia bryophila]NYH13544.1 DNA invertase Pin-like site-specific DNA recombinase [Paraburkholderia bryophila]
MASGKFVAYYRVSTQKQGQSGLGLDAQREAVRTYLNGGRHEVVQEFTEVETGKGSNALSRRPQLAQALALCRKTGARLLIAKLDRLARNVHFISGLMESKVKFVACDMPEANELTTHLMAAFAQYEAQRISERTRDALAAAKARGVVLGVTGPANLRPNIEARQQAAQSFAEGLSRTLNSFSADGLTQRQQVDELNRLGICTARGGHWSLMQLQRVRARLNVPG